MKPWDRVSLTWECGQGHGTALTENGTFDPKISENPSKRGRHDLLEMSAFSVYTDRGDQRRGLMTIRIKQKLNVDPAIEVIVERLKQAFSKLTKGPRAIRRHSIHIEPPQNKSWIDGKFTFTFILADREQFCDQVIEIGRAVLEALGIEDSKGYILANFSVKRETFVMIDGSWITFARWLRISHRLPYLHYE